MMLTEHASWTECNISRVERGRERGSLAQITQYWKQDTFVAGWVGASDLIDKVIAEMRIMCNLSGSNTREIYNFKRVFT